MNQSNDPCNITFSGWHLKQQWTGKFSELYCHTHWVLTESKRMPEDASQELLDAEEKAMRLSLALYEEENRVVEEPQDATT